MIYDMHVHTDDSPDASIPARELALRAGAEGLAGIGFVAHLDLHPGEVCPGAFDPAGYRRSLDEAAAAAVPGLEVLRGLEVGEPHRFGKEADGLADYRTYDFVVAGLHHTRLAGFVLGPEGFRGSDPVGVIRGYLEESLEIVRDGDADILAHFGLFRRGMAMAGLDPAVDEHALCSELVTEILRTLIRRGIALELNCAGLRRRERMTYPTPSILHLYRSLGGRLVTLGSDTHDDPWVFYGLEEGRRLLIDTGFREAFFFRGRRPVPYPLG